MRRFLASVLLCAPIAVFAASPCKYEAPRNLQLDLAGVRGIQIDVHSQDLHLVGSPGAKGIDLKGRACASDQRSLEGLQITHRRDGDQLLIDIGGGNSFSMNLFGSSYANLEATMQIPDNLPVTVSVGSGDADVADVHDLKSHVGSGDLHVRRVSGSVGTSVGSGDIHVSDIGSLDLGSVGSGDFNGDGVHGDARIGSIGSGDVGLKNVGGSVRADTLGSGDLKISDVRGDFSLGAKGSGDVSHAGVQGKVSVPNDDD
jgi:hypothetical protein